MKLPVLAGLRIGVIGLGYVGLPLAVYLARRFPVTGFDIDERRVAELKRGIDRTREVTEEEFAAAKSLGFSAGIEALRDCNFFIVTVPTPVDQANRPDLSALIEASRLVGTVLAPGNVVVYESTVYPGATEEICVPSSRRRPGCASTGISASVIRQSASIPATRPTASATSSRLPPARLPKRPS